VKLREKVFTTIPCPVFLMEFKVGDFYFSFYGSLFSKKGFLFRPCLGHSLAL